MGSSKSENFSNEELLLASYTKALAHPARIAILRILLRKKSCMCGDIVNLLPLSQSTVSQHLKELKEVGLIKGDVEGKKICYCINEAVWLKAKLLLHNFFSDYSTCETACC
jgi:DNA-binding transcriptional ArsR family regulator